MTEQPDAEKVEDDRPRDGSSGGDIAGAEPDLRTVMSGGTVRRVVAPAEQVETGEVEQRPGSPPRSPQGGQQSPDRVDGEVKRKLPPVWPGDEKKAWFRRERGLPPLPPESSTRVNPRDLPTPLADIPTRGRAFGIGFVLPSAVTLLFPVSALLLVVPIVVANLFLYRRGQDVGAAMFRLRVVRENGDVAGFFHMAVRSAASGISLLAFGAGFWGVFSDSDFRTWHDKWLGTYVVKDAEEYNTRNRSSSNLARRLFWVVLFFAAAMIFLFLQFALSTNGTTPAA